VSKSTTLHLTPSTLLEILASSLANILPSLNKLHLNNYNYRACYYHIRQLRCIRPYLHSSTVCTIATYIVHSKLDYCNSLYCKLPKSQLARLQQIQNSLARIVVKAPNSCHIIPIIRSHNWLRITERVEYKLLSLQNFHSYPIFILS